MKLIPAYLINFIDNLLEIPTERTIFISSIVLNYSMKYLIKVKFSFYWYNGAKKIWRFSETLILYNYKIFISLTVELA